MFVLGACGPVERLEEGLRSAPSESLNVENNDRNRHPSEVVRSCLFVSSKNQLPERVLWAGWRKNSLLV